MFNSSNKFNSPKAPQNNRSSYLATNLRRSIAPDSGLKVPLKLNNRASSNSIQVTSPRASVGGKSQAEWGNTWWQRAPQWIESPETANSHVDEPGPVTFLPGTFSKGDVTVSTGEHIFTPVLNVPVDTIEVKDNSGVTRFLTVEEERAVAKSILDAATNLFFNITHGKTKISPIQNWEAYRQVSPTPFSYTLGGTTYYNAVSDGYWVMLNPLSPGTYNIDFGGTFNFRNANGVGVIDIDGDGNVNGQTTIETNVQKLYDAWYPNPYALASSYTVKVAPQSKLPTENSDLWV